jgi:hypothetical protein
MLSTAVTVCVATVGAFMTPYLSSFLYATVRRHRCSLDWLFFFRSAQVVSFFDRRTFPSFVELAGTGSPYNYLPNERDCASKIERVGKLYCMVQAFDVSMISSMVCYVDQNEETQIYTFV